MKQAIQSLRNERLMASAGSGKTYALTNRYISILLRQPEPHKVIAMTFTRKAAGEFFQKTFAKLAVAGSSEHAAKRLSAELKVSAIRTDYLFLLRQMVEYLPQLHLNTYDGFFIYLTRCFYPELGLSSNPEILLPEEEDATQNRIITNILTGGALSSEQQQSFLRVLQHLHSGKESTLWMDTLKDLIDKNLSLFYRIPNAAAWGNPERILSLHPQWIPFVKHEDSTESFEQAKADFLQQLQDDPVDHRIHQPLATMADEIDNLHATGTGKINTLLQRILQQAPQIVSQKSCSVLYNRKEYFLNNALCTPLAQMLLHAIGRYLRNIFLRTHTAGLFLSFYHSANQREIHRTGKFSYQDITRLLTPSVTSTPFGSGADKELLYYRMDARLDHWLLDEFQDTSSSQWQVIQPLVDEVIQDSEKHRSFFYVGDVKQCLYLWRGSNDSLFQDIFDYYSPEIADGEALKTSWRSYPEIIDTINKVFGVPAVLQEQLSVEVYERWIRYWSDHQSAPPLQKNGDAYAQLKILSPAADDQDASLPCEVSQLLEQLNPLRRGLTVAIILRSNKEVQETANYLRKHTAFPVSVESNQAPFTDNLAGVLIQCWLRRCLHPGEQACERMLLLYHPALLSSAKQMEDEFQRLRETWFSQGSEAAVLRLIPHVLQALSQQGKIDALYRIRARQCREAAGIFDRKNIHDQDLFLDFIQHYRVIDNGSAQSVQVTTIHKSKGLDYDIVITLADKKGFLNKSNRANLVSSPASNTDPCWVMEQIPEDWQFLFPAIQEQADKQLQERAFGELCALYVAITRAKRGLYMFVDGGDGQGQTSPDSLLRRALQQDKNANQNDDDSILYTHGNPDWHLQHALQTIVSPSTAATDRLPESSPLPIATRLQQFIPSHSSRDKTYGRWYFSSGTANQRHLGTAVHELFETVEWLPDDTDSWYSVLQPHQGSIPEETFRQLISYIRQPDWIPLFTRPQSTDCELWREKTFSVILNNQWIHGVFDRVIITYDSSRRASQVRLIDFKTDRIDNQKDLLTRVEHHRSQLQTYREALRQLLRTDHIQATLAFLNNGQLVNLN